MSLSVIQQRERSMYPIVLFLSWAVTPPDIFLNSRLETLKSNLEIVLLSLLMISVSYDYVMTNYLVVEILDHLKMSKSQSFPEAVHLDYHNGKLKAPLDPSTARRRHLMRYYYHKIIFRIMKIHLARQTHPLFSYIRRKTRRPNCYSL